MSEPRPCPCGSGRTLPECCGRFHRGEARPATAELLMRSRYSAFALGDAAYLSATWHPATRPLHLDLDPGQRWTRLEVLRTTGGGFLDARGTVEFRAHLVEGGRPGVLHEDSAFTRDGGRWVYVGPVAPVGA